MSITSIILQLAAQDDVSLLRVAVTRDDLSTPIIAVRGKTGGAFEGATSFPWTKAVKALVMLLVQHKLSVKAGRRGARLLGRGNSPARSLDYAISKKPLWLLDMFGFTPSGESVSGRLFRRSNPEGKRPGPTAISFNDTYLSPHAVQIYLEDTLCDETCLDMILSSLQSDYQEQFGENTEPLSCAA